MNFFRRRIDEGLGDDAPNDCDLEAGQQQRITRAGYSQPEKRWGSQWQATDRSGNREQVPPETYTGDGQ